MNIYTTEYLLNLPAYLRPINWRWLVALEFEADITKDIKLVRSYPDLYSGVLFIRKYRPKLLKQILSKRELDYTFTRLERVLKKEIKLKHFIEAWQIYNTYIPGSLRWILEALFLTDLTIDDISKILDNKVKPEVLLIYRHYFSDFELYKQNPYLVNANIFALEKRKSYVLDCNIGWKLLAYSQGADIFLEYINPKNIDVNPIVQSVFRRILADANIKLALKESNNIRPENVKYLSEIYNQAVLYWEISGTDKRAVKDAITKETFTKLSNLIDFSLAKAIPKEVYSNYAEIWDRSN